MATCPRTQILTHSHTIKLNHQRLVSDKSVIPVKPIIITAAFAET